MSAELSFSTKFQRWNNVGSSTLNRRNSINIVSTLFWQYWINVDKCASAQLSFSTKHQCWNVDERWRSTLFQRWCVCRVIAGKTTVIKWILIKAPCKNNEWKLNCNDKQKKGKNSSSRVGVETKWKEKMFM